MRVVTFLSERWLLILILLVGIGVRLYEFNAVPSGLNEDEASTGYDAFALLHYGIDRNGFHFPVMMVSWGSGQNALPVYLAIPLFLLFGASAASLRAVNLVGGIGSLLVFYALVRKTGDEALALTAVFLLAISPWHIMLSRWELESNLLPAVFLIAVLFLRNGRENPRSFLWAGLFFGLTLYAYGTAYLATPVFLALACLSFVWSRPTSWKPVAGAAAVFGGVATPIALFLAVNHFKLTSIRTPVLSIPRLASVPRYDTIATLFGGNGASVLWNNLHDLGRVLVSGNDGLISNAVPGFAFLYVLGLPLAVLGVLFTVSRRRFWQSPTEFLFLAWLADALVVAASESVNINRVNVIFLPLIYFAAVGIRTIATTRVMFGVRTIALSRVMFAAIVVYFCVAFLQFSHAYFGSYDGRFAGRTTGSFFPSFGEAIDKAASATTGPLCITGLVNQPYIFVLFYQHVDPHLFLQTVKYANPGAEFQGVESFGRYTFGLNTCNAATTAGYVADETEQGLINQANFSVENVGRYVVALRR